MQAVPVSKPPKRALTELMNEVERKVHHFRKECWNITIELIADHLGIIENPWKYSLPNVKWAGPKGKPDYHGFQQLKEHIQGTGLIETYIDAAKKEPGDYLGDIFVEEELAGRKNRLAQILTPMHLVEAIVKMVGVGEQKERPKPDAATEAWLSIESMAYDHKLGLYSDSSGHKYRVANLFLEQQRLRQLFDIEPLWTKYTIKPQTVIDPAGSGTGRFLLGATWHAPKKPLILFGIELDISLYRASLVNMAMFSHHAYSIINADALRLDERCGCPSYKVWDYGNLWNPIDMSPFYAKPKEAPISRNQFSLEYYVKTIM
jgi:hypothetical protein